MPNIPHLDIDTLHTRLRLAPIGHTIDYHASVDSTMPIAHAWARTADTQAGMVVVAEEQTSGRGRSERRWNAPRGQALLLSVVVKPPLLPFAHTQLVMAAGLAACTTLEQFVPSLKGKIGLKWPNDVLAGSPDRMGKIAGILIETTFRGADLAYAILGIGLNVNQSAGQLPPTAPGAPSPTSLYLLTGEQWDRTELLITLCRQLGDTLSTAARDQDLHFPWRKRLLTLGQSVTVHYVDTSRLMLTGRAVDVTPQGELLVLDSAGDLHPVTAGDVTIRSQS